MKRTITVTPVSKRGTLGSPVSFSVQVLASAPVLKFEADRLERVAHGSTSTMKSVEYANIDKVTITNVPAGWNVDLQKGRDNEATLTVTAPSATAEALHRMRNSAFRSDFRHRRDRRVGTAGVHARNQ